MFENSKEVSVSNERYDRSGTYFSKFANQTSLLLYIIFYSIKSYIILSFVFLQSPEIFPAQYLFDLFFLEYFAHTKVHFFDLLFFKVKKHIYLCLDNR